ncbi:hypothetical protein [Candidatus Phyllobacterium onerii]|uniref:hypothetical protein n=1 Tax=Candidatus Phyllobacterium onerii TaxID=3020828 RepID=UPI00232FA2E4|nr:hypothetical protein [Phyllobacterium sp. IY22]
MEWVLYRYRVYRALRYEYSGVDAWRYSAGYKQHMLDGLTPELAVEWEKTFGVVERPYFGGLFDDRRQNLKSLRRQL